ncbi:MAG: hypothetical protein MJE77_00275 [Proteobacteria bacterium]|nr:hypothetical protein [Pseudomonadota bacterium]
MRRFEMLFLSLAFVLVPLAGCDDDDAASDGDASTDPTVYQALGEEAGIRAVVEDFVAEVLNDNRINGYFLNQDAISGTKLIDCLVLQIGDATGGPQDYDADDSGCRSMKESHEGLGISKQDFDAMIEDLVKVFRAKDVNPTYVNAVVDIVSRTEGDIVEDADNNKTIYQRLGAKPGIVAVIDNLVDVVIPADTVINGFFAGLSAAQAARLKTCLVRQVCGATGGPCEYGKEVAHPSEPGVAADNVCKDMMAAHDPVNAADPKITKEDFDALVTDVASALDNVLDPDASAEDKNAIATVLDAMCAMIVDGATGCSTL